MKVYLIYCQTGCTCCSYENHVRGFYASDEDARRRVRFFLTGYWWPVASRYARRGWYSIKEEEAEEISGNRVIVQDRVFEKKFHLVDSDGRLATPGHREARAEPGVPGVRAHPDTVENDDYLVDRL